jgi:ABC-type multidrug transport system permease subunit
MQRILDIGHNDLRLFFKSKTAYVWLFLIPTAFVYFLGFAARGPDDPSNRQPPVLIDNKDTNFLSRALLEEMNAQGMWVVDPTNAAKAARELHIPADFTARILNGQKTRLPFLRREGAGEADGAMLELRLTRALIGLNGHLLEAIARDGTAANLTEEDLRAIRDAPNPVNLNSHFGGRKPVPSGFNFSLPGNLVMYLMLNLLIFGGTSMAASRRNGILKRLTTSGASRLEIVVGKIYGNALLGGAQIIYFLLLGKFVFHVNLGANLPGVILLLLILAWVAGALGVLAGSCLPSEDRVVPICVLTSLLMGALGGCWWPLEVAPPVFKTIALCFPTGWALAGLNQLISFGAGIQAALLPMAVLLGFGAAANFLAVRFFRN